jgi:hypothetical protein
MSGNHRGGRSLFSARYRWMSFGWGICSTRIDFQLGTNGGDANSIALSMEAVI